MQGQGTEPQVAVTVTVAPIRARTIRVEVVSPGHVAGAAPRPMRLPALRSFTAAMSPEASR